jgi:hypothetical protein
MNFNSNRFLSADKFITKTATLVANSTIAEFDEIDVRGYNQISIQVNSIGDADKIVVEGALSKNDYSVLPMINTNNRFVEYIDTNNKTVIVDVSFVSYIKLNCKETNGASMTIKICFSSNSAASLYQQANSGSYIIGQYSYAVVDGTNNYSSIRVSGLNKYRYLVLRAKRRDGNGYQVFTAELKFSYKYPRFVGSGNTWTKGYSILSITEQTEDMTGWIENVCDELEIDMKIDSSIYNGAIIELTLIGVR